MNADTLALSLRWLALPLAAAVIAAGWGAIVSRSLFAMCAFMFAGGAAASAAVLALGAADVALTLALVAVGWAPLLLLGAILLSSRATKAVRRRPPWLSMAAAASAASAMIWASWDIGAPVMASPQTMPTAPAAPWLAALIFVAAVAVVGLLGFSERGVLGPKTAERGQ